MKLLFDENVSHRLAEILADVFPGSDILPERRDRFQKRIGFRLHVPMQKDRALLVQNTQVHRSSMQIDSTVMGVLLRIESHRPPLS